MVYARDARGSVVGRQLLAISEADQLVCFAVYGAARAELEPLFRAYDQALAAKLGLAIYKDDPSYEIDSILSRVWWDDHAWEELETEAS